MKAQKLIAQVTDADALDFVADLLPWWRRRGAPEMRARARRAQELIEQMRRNLASTSNNTEVAA